MSRSRGASRRAGRARSRVRAFYALPLPDEVAEALAAWGERCAALDRDLRATSAARMHVTVCFLGERPAGEVDALADALDGAAGPWVPLRVRGPVVLARGGVLAAALEDVSRAYAPLCRRVAAGAGATPARRPLPHVTAARVRGGRGGPGRGLPPPPAEAWTSDRLDLVRSRLGPDGPAYEVLASAR